MVGKKKLDCDTLIKLAKWSNKIEKIERTTMRLPILKLEKLAIVDLCSFYGVKCCLFVLFIHSICFKMLH